MENFSGLKGLRWKDMKNEEAESLQSPGDFTEWNIW